MEKGQKKIKPVVYIVLAAILIAAALVGVLFFGNRHMAQLQQGTEVPGAEDIVQGVPLQTDHIALTFPADLMEQVAVEYEELTDGQQAIFYTELAGEKLELFRLSLTLGGTDGYRLGVLQDETAGDLIVCVDVKSYTEGTWKPEDYSALNALQERVNDIIAQVYEDSRFVPDR